MQDQLLFVISPPRSGSTLLQRMLGSHSQIFTHPEPHLITPLAYLGFYDTVDKAPYDHINAAEAIRAFVQGLPHGEQDYLDALRAYSDTLYGRMLRPSGRRYFLDKTPAYALVTDFLTKVYPAAHYVVLTRHPLAVMSSYANSFFNGDWATALRFNPIVERYVPAMAKFIRQGSVPFTQVGYEALVADPEPHLARIFEFLDLPHEPEAVEYGTRFSGKKGMGDPITVEKHNRPVTDSVEKWVSEVLSDPTKLRIAREIIDRVDPADLEIWGYPKESIFAPLDSTSSAPSRLPAQPTWTNPYVLKRRVLLALKKDIHERPLGRMVKRVRYYCDVLLRD